MFYDVFSWLCSQHGKAETSVCRELGMEQIQFCSMSFLISALMYV